jgi:hypothetical protein
MIAATTGTITIFFLNHSNLLFVFCFLMFFK